MQFIPFILRSPSVKKLKMSDALVIPCPNTVYLYLPMGVVIHSKSWDSTSTLTWWYPEVRSKDTKHLLSGLIFLSSWDELSVGHVGRSIALLSFFPFSTGNTFYDHFDRSVPHFTRIPVSKQSLTSFSYIFCKWNGVLNVLILYNGVNSEISFNLIFTGGWSILSSFDKTSLK